MKLILSTLLLIFQFQYIKGQRIENVNAVYQNDTLTIVFDVTGKTKLDSIEVNISSKTGKIYNFQFQGNINNGINPGVKKKVWTFVDRDSFPENGESLKIRLKAWSTSTIKTKKGKWKRSRGTNFFLETPDNPRFTLASSVGIILRNSEFSKIGQKVSGVFYYHPNEWFQVGIGGSFYNFLDSIKSFSTAYGMISTKYSFRNLLFPKYLVLDYGYCFFNEGPVISAGIGYKDAILGPVNIDISAQLHKFYGYYNFYTLTLNAGISIDFSSRKRYMRERVYKFRNFMIYAETGINYLSKLSPNVSLDLGYKITSTYTQGLGISFESINYKFKTEYKSHYYSEYYQENIEYIAGIVDYELKVIIVPIYLNGRLYLSAGKFRPYLLWKYGFTLYSNAERGKLENGFVGDIGIGFQTPIDKKKAITMSVGAKFFDNKYRFSGIENNMFGTVFIKTGIVFLK